MDLIDLYHHRGVSLVRSRLAKSPASRRGYGKLARRYAEQIEHQRQEREQAVLIPAV